MQAHGALANLKDHMDAAYFPGKYPIMVRLQARVIDGQRFRTAEFPTIPGKGIESVDRNENHLRFLTRRQKPSYAAVAEKE